MAAIPTVRCIKSSCRAWNAAKGCAWSFGAASQRAEEGRGVTEKERSGTSGDDEVGYEGEVSCGQTVGAAASVLEEPDMFRCGWVMQSSSTRDVSSSALSTVAKSLSAVIMLLV